MHIKTLVTTTFLFALLSPPLVWSQAFEVSGKPIQMTWPTRDWSGQHSFPGVFCLTYPNARDALALTQVMFNGNTLYLARVTYPNNVAIYIATSVFPSDRTPSEEVAKMLEINRLNAQSIPTEIAVSELSTDFGPTVGLLMRNAVEGNAAAPFPFARKIAKPPDGSLRSLSVHRMFVRGPDRIEVAGLQYFEPPIKGSGEAEATNHLTAAVDSVVGALQKCTTSMPTRGR